MIHIIDYHGGNTPSVRNALEKIGFSSKLLQTPEAFANASLIILPGVGSAAATLASLSQLALIEPLQSYIDTEKRPFLGICIGYQLLFEESAEEQTRCLGLIEGRVQQFDTQHVRVPQIGWNRVTSPQGHPFFTGLSPHNYFYFVNSYYGNPRKKDIAIGSSEYGIPFTAMLHQDNIVATQFHLEKSGHTGLHVLANILRYFKIPSS